MKIVSNTSWRKRTTLTRNCQLSNICKTLDMRHCLNSRTPCWSLPSCLFFSYQYNKMPISFNHHAINQNLLRNSEISIQRIVTIYIDVNFRLPTLLSISMNQTITIRPAQIIPQHLVNTSTISIEFRLQVVIRHPRYSSSHNVLLVLGARDHANQNDERR